MAVRNIFAYPNSLSQVEVMMLIRVPSFTDVESACMKLRGNFGMPSIVVLPTKKRSSSQHDSITCFRFIPSTLNEFWGICLNQSSNFLINGLQERRRLHTGNSSSGTLLGIVCSKIGIAHIRPSSVHG